MPLWMIIKISVSTEGDKKVVEESHPMNDGNNHQ